jgi:capsid protein
MSQEFDTTTRPNVIDRVIGYVSPQAAFRRMVSRAAIQQFGFDGARSTTKRAQAPQNIAPNDTRFQADRIQLMREAIDLENNFAPAKTLNRKYAMYVAPVSYHAQTGDPALDADVEHWLTNEFFTNCDISGRFDFFTMMAFGVMGMNRAGDHGWAFMRPGLEDGMGASDAVKLPFRIQNVEGDRIGGLYQTIVSNEYVAGCLLGRYGEIDAFRIFRRATTVGLYDDPKDVPSCNFVHYTDPMRMDTYRGVSKYDTAITDLRDLYEMKDFLKGKAKLASALTVFTSSLGGTVGPGAFDPYATNMTPQGQGALQQDINYGQMNHLTGQQDIKFPDTASPGAESQYLMEFLMKNIAMGFNLPYSFALDASELGGVSARLESEQAKAEFERGQRILAPKAHRIKNAALMDAIAKGLFPARVAAKIGLGRWGYRPHPQPDIGREAQADISRWQNGLLDPLAYWPANGQDPETVARNMSRWVTIKKKAAEAEGHTIEEVFGNGPSMPTSVSISSKTDADGNPMDDKSDGSTDAADVAGEGEDGKPDDGKPENKKAAPPAKDGKKFSVVSPFDEVAHPRDKAGEFAPKDAIKDDADKVTIRDYTLRAVTKNNITIVYNGKSITMANGVYQKNVDGSMTIPKSKLQ